ncbi:hypothetical protein H072_6803 [Dactylellina haptotyla CBS 200.50]|uniref:IPT/TIG domain-containing protein n=1 Tax=Dactylellina haptotyla (strain CBS 200.50) TaxID=1284197 RepID=S8A8S8_DACHA|nr:hypothetical protein H072_6803 [Dactylellina haptotyla CBS 200.50]
MSRRPIGEDDIGDADIDEDEFFDFERAAGPTNKQAKPPQSIRGYIDYRTVGSSGTPPLSSPTYFAATHQPSAMTESSRTANRTSSEYIYHLTIEGDQPGGLISERSRVETQIQIKLHLSDLPARIKKLHLPTYTISNTKFLCQRPHTKAKDTLELYTHVICASSIAGNRNLIVDALHRAIEATAGTDATDRQTEIESGTQFGGNPLLLGSEARICDSCIARERKRISRKKIRNLEEEELLSKYETQRILVFSCSEILEWQLAKPIASQESDFGIESFESSYTSRGDAEVWLPTRIACYCRHHAEKIGFQIIFTIKDFLGNVVAQNITPPIFITDDHKPPSLSQIPYQKFIVTVPRTIKGAKGPPLLESSRSSSFTSSSDTVAKESTFGSLSNTHNLTGSPIRSLKGKSKGKEIATDWQKPYNLDLDAPLRGRRAFSNLVDEELTLRYFDPDSSSQDQEAENPYLQRVPSILRDFTRGYNQLDAESTYDPPEVGSFRITRIIPSEYPCAGGIEVTILGRGLQGTEGVQFGDNESLHIAYCRENVIVCLLPASSISGSVLVTIKDSMTSNTTRQGNAGTFVYTEDIDSKTLALALQVVYAKWCGEIAHPKEIVAKVLMDM